MCCGKKKNNKVYPVHDRDSSGKNLLLTKSLLLCALCVVF